MKHYFSSPVNAVQNANENELQSMEALWASKAAAKKKLQAACQLIPFTVDYVRHPPKVKLCGSIENLLVSMASVETATKPVR